MPSSKVTAANPSGSGPGFPVNLAPDPNEWEVTYLADSDAWQTATKDFSGDLTIVVQDDPYFDYERGNNQGRTNNGDELYTIELLDAPSDLGFTLDTYRVSESVGTATIGLSSSSSPIRTATFIIQDDDQNNDFANPLSLNEIAIGDPANNDAAHITSGTRSTNVGATKEPGEPNHAGNFGGASVWWSWTAPYSGSVQITADGFTAKNSEFDALLGIYTGSSVSGLTEVASNDDAPPSEGDSTVLDSRVTFNAVAGTTYQIAVDGYNGAIGSINLNLNVLNFTVPSTSNNLSIPDVGTVTSDLVVSGLSGGTALDMDVSLDITHTSDEDLDVFLTNPAGTRVELFQDVGANGGNFTTTTLDDEAATSISLGAAPFTGSFKPQGLLSTFDSQDPNGTWRLEITDDAGLNVGTLNSWSLNFIF